jgi:uncharacterized metal-binding protein YceD (DUF177 family)
MPNFTQSTRTFEFAQLSDRKPTRFTYQPSTEEIDMMKTALELLDLKKVLLKGEIRPKGKRDWQLNATLGATAQQACVVTLAPVTARIDAPVTRTYLANFETPDPESETEMPEDETIEPLGKTVDLLDVLQEALALELPDYPRAETAEGAEPLQVIHTEEGKQAMRDEDARPFAALAALKDKLEKG